jgi:pimeloyl-ACP methyl ester carboxylesterase
VRTIAAKVVTPVAASFDRALAKVLFGRSARSKARSSAESLGPIERIRALAEVHRLYDDPRAYDDPDTFFPVLDAADLRIDRVGDFGDGRRTGAGRQGEVLDLRWRSALPPSIDDPAVRERLETRALVNHTAVVRLFAHRDRPRPTIILLHGYMGGAFAIEERAFPVRWLFERGLDVVLGVLPHHGLRGIRGRRPLLPSSDPRITIESFRHAIVDLRTLTRVLRARGAPAIGAMGMSLGGYTTALLGTVEELAFAFPMIPLASIAEVARDENRLIGTATQRREQYEALELAHRIVSPFARPSRVDPERVLVIAGEGDRITPVAHARRIADHFRARTHFFSGGHLLQLGRDEGFREVARVLGRAGLLDPRV